MFNYTVSRSDAGLTVYVVFGDGNRLIFGPDHPNAERANELITSHDPTSGEALSESQERKLHKELAGLHDIGADINSRLREVSSRFSYAEGTLRFDGDIIDRTLTRVIIDRMKAGDDDWASYARFMLRLAQNPSRESRNALYRWIGKRHLTITEEGYVVGYKGVRNDGTSIHSGKGTVHRLGEDGRVLTESFDHAHLPNEPGSWVEFPRNEVDPDPESSCSLGLHVGSREYAQDFGERLLTVVVDPAAVVMVPRDSDGQKMRVWQYMVTDIEPARAYAETTVSYGVAFDPFDEDDQDEDEEPVCEQCGDNADVTDGYCYYTSCRDWAQQLG